MQEPARTLPNEEAAEFATDIKGWVCKTCRRFYGNEQGAERLARFCCEKDHACETKGCENRVERTYIICESCRERAEKERYLALPQEKWDGETPLVIFNDDTYFSDEDSLLDHAAELGIKVADMMLVICEVDPPPSFDMMEFLHGHISEDLDVIDGVEKIEKAVEDWIKENVPTMWVQGKKRPTPDSLPKETE